MFYVGVTNDLENRVYSHKFKLNDGYTKKYNIHRLVYFEETDDISWAIRREKQLKGWSRKKKIDLIESTNKTWDDVAKNWFK